MARRYEVSAPSNVPFGLGIYGQLSNTGSNDVKVREIALVLEDNQAGPNATDSFAIVRAIAQGTPTGGTTPIAVDGGDPASGAVLYTAWTVMPTPGDGTTVTKRLRVGIFPQLTGATGNGQGLCLSWPVDAPLVIPPGTSIVIVENTNAGGGGNKLSITFAFEE